MTGEPPAATDLWVFGYGSLMWRPGFEAVEAAHALLQGYHRALCVYSVRYRGSHERPGLVFGLARGGSCEGIAFRVAPGDRQRVIAYLRDREQVTGVYRARMQHVLLHDGSHRMVSALCFIAEDRHPQRVRGMSLKDQARIVLASRGTAGSNIDYVLSTLRHLRELNIQDDLLERLVTLTGCARLLRRQERDGDLPSRPARSCHRRPYPLSLTPRLPTPAALRCSHRRNQRF